MEGLTRGKKWEMTNWRGGKGGLRKDTEVGKEEEPKLGYEGENGKGKKKGRNRTLAHDRR